MKIDDTRSYYYVYDRKTEEYIRFSSTESSFEITKDPAQATHYYLGHGGLKELKEQIQRLGIEKRFKIYRVIDNQIHERVR
ncbi:hypothetical protein [Fischerella sp. PCC 9605]|uniref:hypothetical protein n=1 Tax=Fischerella sp. PCC 9605 TaxID=1173024 RepID=UPI0004B5767C|nr:hypothetical protein [Fischerella sp. PCC 9605]